ncbi:MAG: FAD-binding oxidoreductase [Sedimentisphaerales bacterium]|nr:FAD-binding oxidoreductase [Sedimentisphaerales bacterium]
MNGLQQLETKRRKLVALSIRAIEKLGQALRGELIEPGDVGYDEARKVWNGLIDKWPVAIARCSGTADVMVCVNFAREHRMPFTVRGGGHNVAGRALCDGGLVIDLSAMRSVRVDPAARTVRAQGGATLGDIDHETQPFGLAVPLGLVSATGAAGLCLHGGAGWLTRRYGLTLDNLISVDIVTADGQLRRAGEKENADLFWAVRGGGGNFGVVTSFEFRAYPVGPEVWFLATLYPMSHAASLLKAVRDFAAAAPEEFGILASLWSAAPGSPISEQYRGAPVLAVLGCYSGPFEQGQAVIQPLRELAEPIADFSGPMPFAQVQTFLDADYPDGMLYYWKSAYLRRLDDEVINVLIDHAARRPSALSSLDVWFLGGAFGRVPPDKTAFARRDVPYVLGIEANWRESSQSDANIAWARAVYDAAQPFAHGLYLNFPGFVEDGDKLLQGAYEANYPRLQSIKAKYDPDNLFQGALNIPPKA